MKEAQTTTSCTTCLDQDTNPKVTTSGTGGTDPDLFKQKPANTKVKVKEDKAGNTPQKAPAAQPKP
ncbi:hypothetical protein DAT35_15820 [Vitiosangium sp. GDMCC 1.1324]|nr:hypothetical protein DAT35_15820 [Vitiosangium sp. GDMCC 1.1324]